MKEKYDFQINVGSSSILLIFVILCLISFAVLSFVSSSSDYKLSNKILNKNIAYYDACNLAEESLKNVHDTLQDIYIKSKSETEYYQSVGGKTLCYTYPISDIQALCIELDVLYPDITNKNYYNITKWQIITTGSLDYDESLHLFIQ